MTNKAITSVLLGLTMLVFILYFSVQSFIFHPAIRQFSHIEQDARTGQWTDARQQLQQFNKIWRRWGFLIPLNFAEQDYEMFRMAYFQLQSGIHTQNQVVTISNAMICEDQWRAFLSFVPKP